MARHRFSPLSRALPLLAAVLCATAAQAQLRGSVTVVPTDPGAVPTAALGEASSLAAGYPTDDGIYYRVQARLASGYTTCCSTADGHEACQAGFPAGAALRVGGTGYAGGTFERSLDLAALTADVPFVTSANYPLGYPGYRNCQGAHARGVTRYLGPTDWVYVGDVEDRASVASTFGHASWDGTIGAEPYGDTYNYFDHTAYGVRFNTFSRPASYNYPLCGHGAQAGASMDLFFEATYKAVGFEVRVEQAELAPGETAAVVVVPVDSAGVAVGMPVRDRVAVSAYGADGRTLTGRGGGVVALSGSTPAGGRVWSWPSYRAAEGRVAGVLAPPEAPAEPETVTVRAWGYSGSRNRHVVGETTVTLCPAGGCGGGALRVTASADTVRAGEAATLTVQAVDAAGEPAELPGGAAAVVAVDDVTWGGFLPSFQATAGAPGAGLGGPALATLALQASTQRTYAQLRTDGALFVASDRAPAEDTPVTVTVTVGGLTGAATLVRPVEFARFEAALRPAEVAYGGRAALTLVPVRDDGRPTTAPPDAAVRLTLSDAVARVEVGEGEGAAPLDLDAPLTWADLEGRTLTVVADGEPVPTDDVGVEVALEVVGAPATRGAAALVVAPPTARLRGQGGAPLADGAPLRVSKVRPDWYLDEADVPFASPYAGTAPFALEAAPPASGGAPAGFHDPDTFRLEVEGLPEGAEPAFRVEVLRGGRPVPIPADGVEPAAGWGPDGADHHAAYAAVGEARAADGAWAFRSARFLRLVSNGRPAEMRGYPTIARYDDEAAGLQTVRVALGDVVRVTAWLGDAEVARAEHAVGTDAPAVVEGTARFVALAGAPGSTDPTTSAARASETFAQAGIRFSARPDVVPGPALRNTLALSSPDGGVAAPAAGALRLRVGEGPTVEVDVAAGDRLDAIVDALAAALEAAGLAARTGRTSGGGRTHTALVTVRPGLPADLAVDATTTGLDAAVAGLEAAPTGFATSLDHLVAAVNHGDGDPSTIDAYVLRQGGLDAVAAWAVDDSESNLYWRAAAVNSVLTQPHVVDGDDVDAPHTFAHELGHVLMDETVNVAADHVHSTDEVNLMSTTPPGGNFAVHDEVLDGRRRLTATQQAAAHAESASASRPGEVVLLRPAASPPE